ncbi:MAG: metallophosphoesterase [Lachnospiraceae bacterium]|nr:metallophosphoesterase [Lachnospiraceae bacterium]
MVIYMYFLHISDMHFGLERGKSMGAAGSAARKTFMQSLTEKICTINTQKKLDFIVLTGDIAWAATKEDYCDAKIWFDELINKTGISRKCILLCPGNHDIDREEMDDKCYPDDQKTANRFLRIEKLDRLQQRFTQYINFCDELGLEKYTIATEKSHLIGCRYIGNVRIVCLNTAWYAMNNSTKDKMWIGADLWELIKAQIKSQEKFTIAIMHHPSTSWHESERTTYQGTTNIYSELCERSNLILSGHTHEIGGSMEMKGSALICAGGALYQTKHYPNCFYTYDFPGSGRQTRVKYIWNDNKWIPDEQDIPNTHLGRAIWGNHKRKNDTIGTKPEELNTPNLFCIGGHVIRFKPIIGSWNKGEGEYFLGDFIVRQNSEEYKLPVDIKETFQSYYKDYEGNINEKKVRLDHFDVSLLGGIRPHQITLYVSEATYRDFLIVKKVMDQSLPSGETVRQKYLDEKSSLISKDLPNICGVGIYIITCDNKILISKSSSYVAVSPNQYIYSASGSMNWKGSETNPFYDVIRECKEEIGYEPSIERLRLYSIGMDYEMGYYQFSFYERSNKKAEDIIKDVKMARDFQLEINSIIAIDFTCEKIMTFITENEPWDETAKANLIMLIVKHFGKKAVESFLAPGNMKTNYRQSVAREWDLRAEREGRLPVLSIRYPARNLIQNSDNYIKAVLEFIDENLADKTVLELGGGIGLFTKHFATKAKAVTCIDVSEKMIAKNKGRLGTELAQRVEYVNCFFQDYQEDKHFDVLICSLVLIHNAPELDEIANNMKRLSDTLYLFEHTDDGAQVSQYTEPKTKEEYIALFPEYSVEKLSFHMLCQDNISFIKLKRKHLGAS